MSNPRFDFPAAGGAHYGATAGTRNRVLRNTYLLLAISMVPTVLGAWVGLKTGISTSLSGWMGLVVFFAGAFGFMYAIERTKHSSAGVAVLLAFTFFMGVMLSRMLGWVLGMGNGTQLVMIAFAGTAGVLAVMSSLATVIKRDLSGAGKWLFVGALVLIVASLINAFLIESTALMAALSTAVIALFSFWLLYDLKRIIDGGETNYISATLGVYLSLYNIFSNLLALLGIFGGDD